MQKIFTLLLIVYTLVLAYIFLLHNRIFLLHGSYFERLRYSINLIPFQSVVDYIGRLQNDFINVDTAYANLFGVVVLYLPSGLLLPLSSEKTEKYGKVVLTVGGFALTVELLQWLLCIGQFDIDDILFALIGCSISYGIYALVQTATKKTNPKESKIRV